MTPRARRSAVLDDLRTAALADGSPGYFRQASDQIGVTETNDFIFGELHLALRQQLYAGIGGVTDVILPGGLPDHPAVRFSPTPVTKADVADLLGLKAAPAPKLWLHALPGEVVESSGRDLPRRVKRDRY